MPGNVARGRKLEICGPTSTKMMMMKIMELVIGVAGVVVDAETHKRRVSEVAK